MEKAEEMYVVETAEIGAKNPAVIVGVPDVGLVGSIATSHIVQSLDLAEVGYVESDIPPPVMVIHKNQPKAPIRVFGSKDLIVVTTQISLSQFMIYPLARSLAKWARKRGADVLVGVTGIAVPNRVEIETPTVYGVGSTDYARGRMEKAGITPLEEGAMVGTYALLLRECMREGQSNITLLAESHYQFPDPGASASVIKSLNTLLGVNVDVKDLLEGAEEIRLKTRELMRRTQEQMRSMEKVREQELQGIYV